MLLLAEQMGSQYPKSTGRRQIEGTTSFQDLKDRAVRDAFEPGSLGPGRAADQVVDLLLGPAEVRANSTQE